MTSSVRRYRPLRRLAFAAQGLVVLGLPFVRVRGESALRFDVPSLTLLAFGARIQIDELFLLLGVVLGLTFAFVLATLVLGRAWCGWSCPQTILSELTAVKGRWRWPAILAVSAAAPATVVLWFVSPYDLASRLVHGGVGPAVAGTWAVLAVACALHLGFVRHRFCATVCPYAKLQGAMFDRHTLVVAYDARRGAECVECRKCLRVCPTGIDIRGGLQSACIACAECVDACGPIMARLGKPNLIGYAWGEPGARRRFARGGAVALAALSCASFGLAGGALATRAVLDVSAAVAPGSAPRRTPDGRTTNSYDLSLTNRGTAPLEVSLALGVGGEPAALRPDTVRLAAGEHRRLRVLAAVRLPAGAGEQPAELVAEAAPGLRMNRTVTFVPVDPGTSR